MISLHGMCRNRHNTISTHAIFTHVLHKTLRAARKHHVKSKEETYRSVLDSILMQFTPKRKRAIKRAISGKTSAWLSVLPLATCHFDLSPAQFRDGLAVRYMRDPTDLPSKCDGCGASLTMQHALDCKVGGLVIQRHNEIRDCIGDIAAQVWTQVIRELLSEKQKHK